ncbi:MAG: ROK family protein [Anaerolineaceae bacterium]|nr:ROK family protein [Anaerolineaceae bacterium]
MIIAAVDIGGSKIALGLVSGEGRLLAESRFATDPAMPYAELVERIRQGLTALSQEGPVSGIGIGCTGRMDAKGVFQANSFLPNLEGRNLAEDLGLAFGVPAAVENDADAAALGEFRWGSGRGSRSMIFVTVSTGIGGGVILGGQLFRGLDGCHPEIGHHVIDPSGPACFCRASGCWESLASGTALGRRGEQMQGEAYGDARRICDLAEQGDPAAQELVQKEARYLGLGLANLITLFAPERIVLGGGLMNRWSLFEAGARAVIRAQCGLVPWQKVSLVRASLGSQTGLLGAAAVWVQRFSAPPTDRG